MKIKKTNKKATLTEEIELTFYYVMTKGLFTFNCYLTVIIYREIFKKAISEV